MSNKILSILLVVMIGAVGVIWYFVYGAYQEYTENDTESDNNNVNEELLEKTYSEINKSSEYAIDQSTLVLSVWDQSIDLGFDFNSVFNYMFSGDISNNEWSGLGMDTKGFSTLSWGSLANRMNLFSSELSALHKDKEKIDELMNQVKSINDEKLNEKIDSLIQYYITYTKIYNAATSPSGNKIGYSSNLTSLMNEYEGVKIEAEMKIQ